MSKKSDRSQGMVRDPARPSSRPAPAAVTAGQVRGQVQRAVDATDAKFAKPPRQQKVTRKQDWRRG